MIYQLIHHDSNSFSLVSESGNIETESEKLAWYNQAIEGQVLPEGRRWAVVEEGHRWFTKVQPKTTVGKGDPLPFEVVREREKERFYEQRKARFDREARLKEYMAKFEG